MATTYVSTIKAADGDYTTLSACEAGRQAAHVSGDISAATGDDSIEEWICYSLDDTTQCAISGWVTAAGNYIYIHCDATGRHAGIWDGAKYNLIETGTDSLSISADYVRVDGLQISVVPDGNGDHPIQTAALTASTNDIWISNCIIICHGNATYSVSGIFGGTNAILKIWNCIIYGAETTNTSTNLIYLQAASSVYSTTGIGGYRGLVRGAAVTIIAKNCYFGGSGNTDYYGTITMTTCASEDATGSEGLQGIAIDTDTFVNVSAGTEDFHLAADGLSPLQGVGTDTSGDAAPMNFTTDIDGDTRS